MNEGAKKEQLGFRFGLVKGLRESEMIFVLDIRSDRVVGSG